MATGEAAEDGRGEGHDPGREAAVSHGAEAEHRHWLVPVPRRIVFGASRDVWDEGAEGLGARRWMPETVGCRIGDSSENICSLVAGFSERLVHEGAP